MKIASTIFCTVFVFLLLPSIQAEEQDFLFQENVMIPMRDGAALAANVFIPKGDGPFPALVIRTPYGKSGKDDAFYVRSGYAFVSQDVRRPGHSDLNAEMEGKDTFDTLKWIHEQLWCDGNIGAWGGSQHGEILWRSSSYFHPYLKTMIIECAGHSRYDMVFHGGALRFDVCTWGFDAFVLPDFVSENPDCTMSKQHTYVPLRSLDQETVGQTVPYWQNYFDHPTYDEYWQSFDSKDFSEVTIPVLNIGGWYDLFQHQTIEQSVMLRQISKNFLARRNQFMIMGPWNHGRGYGSSKLGDLDFPEGNLKFEEEHLKWFDYWLMGKESGIQDKPAYRIFVMGENTWRDEHEWPLARTVFTNYYLQSKGNAQTLHGDGLLTIDPPIGNYKDSFVYEPKNPVPTKGSFDGPYDQQEIEIREDVLVYSTPPLDRDTEITGPIKMMLYAASTALDTDFTAKLCDVHPDGKSFNLCDGIIRARFRNLNTEAEMIQPGEVYQYEIQLWDTSNVFKKGHRIRLEISSSNFPAYDRNPNSGKLFGSDTELLQAIQTIYHNREYPSHVILPVIPR